MNQRRAYESPRRRLTRRARDAVPFHGRARIVVPRKQGRSKRLERAHESLIATGEHVAMDIGQSDTRSIAERVRRDRREALAMSALECSYVRELGRQLGEPRDRIRSEVKRGARRSISPRCAQRPQVELQRHQTPTASDASTGEHGHVRGANRSSQPLTRSCELPRRSEADFHQRAAPRRVHRDRLAVVGVGGLLDDRQAEARARQAARVAGPIEAVEYVRRGPARRSRDRGLERTACRPCSCTTIVPAAGSTCPRCRSRCRPLCDLFGVAVDHRGLELELEVQARRCGGVPDRRPPARACRAPPVRAARSAPSRGRARSRRLRPP